MKRVLFVVPCSPYFPSGVVRVEQYLAALRADGVMPTVVQYFSRTEQAWTRWLQCRGSRHRLRGIIVGAAARCVGALHVWMARARIAASARFFDAVVVQWVVLPPWLVRAIVVQSRLVYDFDDALFVPEPERTRAMVQAAWRVVAGSHALAEYASRFNAHTALVPSAVALAPSVPPPPPHGHLPCIGWIGSAGTLPQLAMLAEPLRRLAAAGERFQVLIAGTEGLRDLLPELPGIRVREVQTYTGADIQSLVSELDIGVMPLNDGPWERGKCAMKALLYMAGGRAVVASAVGENRYAVQHGENGFLAATSDEWVEYLGRLLRDRPLRDHMGSRGLEAVAERYSTEVCYRLLWEHVYADL